MNDKAGDLVQSPKARLLVGGLLRRRARDDLVTGLQSCGRLRHAFLVALSGRIGAGRRDRDTLIGLRRRDRRGSLRILRDDRGSGRRSERLGLHVSRRRHALARQRAVGRRQQTAPRQFGHFFFVVGNGLLLLLTAARHAARRPRLIGKDIADLRTRRRRKRDGGNRGQGRKTGQEESSEHLAALASISESGIGR